jgi:hypothetical protein
MAMMVWFVLIPLSCLVVGLAVSQMAIFAHFGKLYATTQAGRDDQGPPLEVELKANPLRDVRGAHTEIPAAGKPTLIMLASINCKACDAVKPALVALADKYPAVQTQIICKGSPQQVLEWSGQLPSLTVVPDPDGGLSAKLGFFATPAFISVDALGRVATKGFISPARPLEDFYDGAERNGLLALEAIS